MITMYSQYLCSHWKPDPRGSVTPPSKCTDRLMLTSRSLRPRTGAVSFSALNSGQKPVVAMLAHLIPGERVARWLFNVHSALFSHTGQKAAPQEAQLGTGWHGCGLVRTSGEQASICETGHWVLPQRCFKEADSKPSRSRTGLW